MGVRGGGRDRGRCRDRDRQAWAPGVAQTELFPFRQGDEDEGGESERGAGGRGGPRGVFDFAVERQADYSIEPCSSELSDYYKLELAICGRADDTLYNLIKHDNIPNLKTSNFKEIREYKNKLNPCFTNEKRKEINDIKMKEQNNKKHRKHFKLDSLPFDKRTQDVILNRDAPIISRLTMKK